jgi:hypothetical protein
MLPQSYSDGELALLKPHKTYCWRALLLPLLRNIKRKYEISVSPGPLFGLHIAFTFASYSEFSPLTHYP